VAQRKAKRQKAKETAGSDFRCHASLAQLAAALGIGHRTLVRYGSEGLFAPIIPARGRRPALFDGLAVAKVLIGRPDNPRDEKDRAIAELTRLRIAKFRGELVLLTEADAALASQQAAVRSAILRLPAAAVQRGVPREHEALLRGLTHEVLHALGRDANGGQDVKKG
jgi:hypothetical protein